MIIDHLGLANFRNYSHLELDLSPGISIMQGDNAQGKSNLLEAISVLATGKSYRATHEGELIKWEALNDSIPAARVAADVRRAGRLIKLEIALTTDSTNTNTDTIPYRRDLSGAPIARKRIRINGTVRRAVDLVGILNVATFGVDDIAVVAGEPALRRRYLDMVNCQLDPEYLRCLQRYQNVLTRRNHLLRLIAERQADIDELDFWDQEMVRTGAFLTVSRASFLSDIENFAKTIYQWLSGDHSELSLSYRKSIGEGEELSTPNLEETALIFSRRLENFRSREIAQGISLIGPHRDELRFLGDTVDIGTYGSRGQQRTVALALKLAQARLMLRRTGEYPVLLLDDILSELDTRRRASLLQTIVEYEQVIVTTTDFEAFDEDFRRNACLLTVRQGSIRPASP